MIFEVPIEHFPEVSQKKLPHSSSFVALPTADRGSTLESLTKSLLDMRLLDGRNSPIVPILTSTGRRASTSVISNMLQVKSSLPTSRSMTNLAVPY